MISVPDYALLLLLFMVVGFQTGVGNAVVEARGRDESGKSETLDILCMFGGLFGIGCGMYGLGFVWHERSMLVWAMLIVNAAFGVALGKFYAGDHPDILIKGIASAAYVVVPITYWLFLA